jgi:hypothetical protein
MPQDLQGDGCLISEGEVALVAAEAVSDWGQVL